MWIIKTTSIYWKPTTSIDAARGQAVQQTMELIIQITEISKCMMAKVELILAFCSNTLANKKLDDKVKNSASFKL